MNDTREHAMQKQGVKAVLFARDRNRLAVFYCGALGMGCTFSDAYHSVLEYRGFELIIHQIPDYIAEDIEIIQPPVRRLDGALRLDYVVGNIRDSRVKARSLGGDIDEAPPPWADPDTNFYLGFDPEGNQFGVSGPE